MAQVDVKYACGHTRARQISKGGFERRPDLLKELGAIACKDCRAEARAKSATKPAAKAKGGTKAGAKSGTPSKAKAKAKAKA